MYAAISELKLNNPKQNTGTIRCKTNKMLWVGLAGGPEHFPEKCICPINQKALLRCQELCPRNILCTSVNKRCSITKLFIWVLKLKLNWWVLRNKTMIYNYKAHSLPPHFYHLRFFLMSEVLTEVLISKCTSVFVFHLHLSATTAAAIEPAISSSSPSKCGHARP